MHIKLSLTIFLLVQFLGNGIQAQQNNYQFERLTINDGLSQSNAQQIIQDQEGFIWIATQDGLNQFDGYDFTIYRNDPDDDNSISGNRIVSMIEDSEGTIWIATFYNGVCAFDKATRKFTSYDIIEEESNQNIADARRFYIDNEDNLWVFLESGVAIFNKEKDAFRYIGAETFYNGYCFSANSSVLEYSPNELLLITNECFALYLINKHDFSVKEIKAPGLEAFSTSWRFIYKDSKDYIWVGDVGGGLLQYNKDFELLNHFDDTSDSPLRIGSQVRDMLQDKNGNYWVGTDATGLYVINEGLTDYTSITRNQAESKSIGGNTIYDLYEDNSGIIWISHFNGGVSYYDPNAIRFKAYYHNANDATSISQNPVLSVFEDSKGRIWVGTDGGGLNLFNKENGTFKHYTREKNGFTTNVITAISEDNNGNLLLGTWGGGFMVFNPDTGSLKKFLNNHPSIQGHIWRFEMDKNGLIWLGVLGSNKAYYFDQRTQTVSDYETLTGKENILNSQIMTSLEDSNEDIWFGTEGGGVYKYLVDEQQMVAFRHQPDNPNSLAEDVVYTIQEDSRGQIWFGTSNSGISIFNPDEETFTHIKQKDGLPSNAIMGILEADDYQFWISTNNGVCLYQPEENKFTHYTVNDGLQGLEFKYNASLIDNEGNYYLGGLNGLNVFRPGDIKSNTIKPPVYFTDFKLFNQSVDINDVDSPLDKHISATSSIELNHKQNIFEISFVGINYTATKDNEFKYKMVGFDDDYILTKNRSVSYMNLPSGEYTFHVMASNNDGLWNEEGANLEITILPPWWATWWFRIIMTIIIAGAVLLFFRWRTRKLREDQRALKAKVEEATKEVELRNARLSQAQEQLTKIMDDVKNQLGKVSEDLLSATNSEAASIEEMSASVEQMATDINENAKGASIMLQGGKEIEKDTEATVQIMSKAMEAITNINESIGFISDFARKTNLISLNASIEAARAGVHGRSFAVVAAEVRKLADQSQEMANKIQKLSHTGLDLSTNADQKIKDLQKYIQKIVSLIIQISTSSQSQSQQADNINSAIQQLENNVTGTAALAEKMDNAIHSLSLEDSEETN